MVTRMKVKAMRMTTSISGVRRRHTHYGILPVYEGIRHSNVAHSKLFFVLLQFLSLPDPLWPEFRAARRIIEVR